MKKIYTSKPLSYRQWGQIKKEMYRLVLCIAALVAANTVLEVIAQMIVH